MKTRFLFIIVLVSLAIWSAPLHAKDIYVFKPRIYVFKNSDFREFKADSAAFTKTGESAPHWLILTSPTTLRFDRLTLDLTREKFAWSDATLADKKFSLLTAPTVVTNIGQKATLWVGSPTQYFEKLPDGSFHLQELPKDSPASPHCTITLLARPDDTATGSLAVTFAADIAATGAREKIPGVDLDVGKPILAVFKDELKFTAPCDAWTALLCQSPGGSDYSLLLLLKVSQQEAPAAPAGQKLVPAPRPAPPADAQQR